jgi:hypothetical protein
MYSVIYGQIYNSNLYSENLSLRIAFIKRIVPLLTLDSIPAIELFVRKDTLPKELKIPPALLSLAISNSTATLREVVRFDGGEYFVVVELVKYFVRDFGVHYLKVILTFCSAEEEQVCQFKSFSVKRTGAKCVSVDYSETKGSPLPWSKSLLSYLLSPHFHLTSYFGDISSLDSGFVSRCSYIITSSDYSKLNSIIGLINTEESQDISLSHKSGVICEKDLVARLSFLFVEGRTFTKIFRMRLGSLTLPFRQDLFFVSPKLRYDMLFKSYSFGHFTKYVKLHVELLLGKSRPSLYFPDCYPKRKIHSFINSSLPPINFNFPYETVHISKSGDIVQSVCCFVPEAIFDSFFFLRFKVDNFERKPQSLIFDESSETLICSLSLKDSILPPLDHIFVLTTTVINHSLFPYSCGYSIFIGDCVQYSIILSLARVNIQGSSFSDLKTKVKLTVDMLAIRLSEFDGI